MIRGSVASSECGTDGPLRELESQSETSPSPIHTPLLVRVTDSCGPSVRKTQCATRAVWCRFEEPHSG